MESGVSSGRRTQLHVAWSGAVRRHLRTCTNYNLESRAKRRHISFLGRPPQHRKGWRGRRYTSPTRASSSPAMPTDQRLQLNDHETAGCCMVSIPASMHTRVLARKTLRRCADCRRIDAGSQPGLATCKPLYRLTFAYTSSCATATNRPARQHLTGQRTRGQLADVNTPCYVFYPTVVL